VPTSPSLRHTSELWLFTIRTTLRDCSS
jgi:hypothetical protein